MYNKLALTSNSAFFVSLFGLLQRTSGEPVLPMNNLLTMAISTGDVMPGTISSSLFICGGSLQYGV